MAILPVLTRGVTKAIKPRPTNLWPIRNRAVSIVCYFLVCIFYVVRGRRRRRRRIVGCPKLTTICVVFAGTDYNSVTNVTFDWPPSLIQKNESIVNTSIFLKGIN